MLLLVLPDRDAAESAHDDLAASGLDDLEVHREALAGDDDADDAQWVVVVPGTAQRDLLEAVAERRDGWVEEH